MVVDGRGGARGDEAEVLGGGGEEEGVKGGDGGEGLNFGGGCLGWYVEVVEGEYGCCW